MRIDTAGSSAQAVAAWPREASSVEEPLSHSGDVSAEHVEERSGELAEKSSAVESHIAGEDKEFFFERQYHAAAAAPLPAEVLSVLDTPIVNNRDSPGGLLGDSEGAVGLTDLSSASGADPEDLALKSVDFQQHRRISLAASSSAVPAEASLCEALPSARFEEAPTPAGSTSGLSEDHNSSTECGFLLPLKPSRNCVAAAPPPSLEASTGVERNSTAATHESLYSAEGRQGPQASHAWEGEVARRTRPPRRAAAAAAAAAHTRRHSEEEAPAPPPLGLRAPPLGSRVVSRLPGVKYCHSRNAWIARWSEEGQERWEKVRMKYAKLMKQATPQPGLIGTAPAEGPVEALEMDAEAAELAAALQIASTSKTASPVWAESEQGPPPACSPALSPAGPPPQKAALLTRRELEEALIKSEPEKGISGEHSLSELDLKMQLLLQDRGGTTDLESGLLRLVANSAGRLGGARGGAVRGSELRALSGSKEGASSHDIASVLGMREVSPLSAKQSWGEAPADQGFVEGLNTLTRFLADENRSLSTAAADAAARGGGVIGLTNWVTSPLTQSTRSGGESCNGTPGGPVFGAERESFEGPLAEDGVDLQPWRRAVCVILEDVLENCILEVGSQPREGGSMSLERLQFAPMVGRLKALAARSCSKAELRPFLRLFSRSIRLGLVPSKQSEDVQQLILDALGALDDALAASRAPPPLALATRGHLDSVDTPSPFTLLPAGSGFS
ncbi:hypothetical protein cyc_03028 [Cyclospora cayetanensis]|uniref:AP2-coincident C-terminal domain-containing protein n=1 Tax=Cyclospora cayetanensis TaxID=88456 RepID=A0A1D3CX12_9EIME|nr:hypothetical protein cyc_03028 [Cyclospora cayetanensis]